MHHVATRTFLVLAAAALGAGAAEAQVGLTSNVAQVSINATKNSTLSVAVTSGATQTLATLTDNAANNFPTPVAVTTTWDLNAGTSVSLVGWFGTAANALVSGGNSIPSSWVKASLNGGVYNPFNQTPSAASGRRAEPPDLLPVRRRPSPATGTTTSGLQIDLTGQALVPGTYAGTLNLQAVVQ